MFLGTIVYRAKYQNILIFVNGIMKLKLLKFGDYKILLKYLNLQTIVQLED
uniref:Uncharacterized protein n=1 Tax=Anguilla anguilla TaxID=7936 RepID=A0A0E9R5D9_ANGAN